MRPDPDLRQPGDHRRASSSECARALADVLVVDDGSGRRARAAIDDARAGRAARASSGATQNGGKGAAVKTGLRAARELGFTHALQIDADGQHDTADIPQFLAARAEQPARAGARPSGVRRDACRAAPRRGRQHHELLGVRRDRRPRHRRPAVRLPRLPGRARRSRSRARGDRMDFDPEIAVRLVWARRARSSTCRRACATSRATRAASRTSGLSAITCASPGCTRACCSIVASLRRSAALRPRCRRLTRVTAPPADAGAWLRTAERGQRARHPLLICSADCVRPRGQRGCCSRRSCFYFVAVRARGARARRATTCARLGPPDGFRRRLRATSCASRSARSTGCSSCSGKLDAFAVHPHGHEHLAGAAAASGAARCCSARTSAASRRCARMATDERCRSTSSATSRTRASSTASSSELNPDLAARVIDVERGMRLRAHAQGAHRRGRAGGAARRSGRRSTIASSRSTFFGAPRALPDRAVHARGDPALPGLPDVRPATASRTATTSTASRSRSGSSSPRATREAALRE